VRKKKRKMRGKESSHRELGKKGGWENFRARNSRQIKSDDDTIGGVKKRTKILKKKPGQRRKTPSKRKKREPKKRNGRHGPQKKSQKNTKNIQMYKGFEPGANRQYGHNTTARLYKTTKKEGEKGGKKVD